jgi:hypothetical protein
MQLAPMAQQPQGGFFPGGGQLVAQDVPNVFGESLERQVVHRCIPGDVAPLPAADNSRHCRQVPSVSSKEWLLFL